MSTQLKEKQNAKDQAPSRELQADFHFNQHIFRTIAYTAAGFGVGMLSSLLFKHKAGMTIFFAGTGAGYGGANFVNELTNFRSKRNVSQISQRGDGQSQIKDKLERVGSNIKGDLQQAKDKVQHGTEDLSGYMANKVNQTARGAEEWGRNLADKASENFSQKDHRRGGDDDKDDSKNKKQDQHSQRREQDQHSQRREQDQHSQRREQDQHSQRREQDQHSQRRDQDSQSKNKDQSSSQRGTQSAQKNEGSAGNRNAGDIREDQFTSKVQSGNANQGYQSATQQFEGSKVNKNDQSKFGQGNSAADENKTLTKKGQHFQDFHSNPVEAGPKSSTMEANKNYQLNRNRAQEDLDNKRRAQKGLEQDVGLPSVKTGNNMKIGQDSETKQGFQNYKTGVAPSNTKNQVDAHA